MEVNKGAVSRRWSGILAAFARWTPQPKILVVLAVLIGIGVSLYSFFKPDYSYGRITAHLLYKGQPVTMDWIVTCKSIARGGNMTGYVHTEVDPYYYGTPTPDGGMVVAVTPSYCGGVPTITNYMPVFMTGDKAGDFSFMTAYLAEEAYGNPVSKLSVLDVTLAPVTKTEKWAVRKSGTPNLVPDKAHAVQGQSGLVLTGEGGSFMGPGVGSVPSCVAFERIPVIPELRPAVVAAHKAEPGTYWIPRNVPDIARTFYLSISGSDKASYALELASQGYGAVRRPASAQASKGRVTVGAPNPKGTLVFDPRVFVITPIDNDVWHDQTAAQSIPRPDKQNLMPILKIVGRIDADAVGMAYCGLYPNTGFDYRFQNSYLFTDGVIFETEFNNIVHNVDVMYRRVNFYADPERSAQ